MYSYVFESFLQEKRFRKSVIQIENRITDLGMIGSIRKLTILNDIREVAAQELSKNIHTVVAVGSDKLITQMIDVLATYKICLGIIPIGQNTSIADMFSIPHGVAACDVLSKRNIKKIHLSKINDFYFIKDVILTDPDVKMRINDLYDVTPRIESMIAIQNTLQIPKENPQISPLTAIIQPKEEGGILSLFKKHSNWQDPTFIPAHKIHVFHKKSIKLFVDGKKIVKTPAIVTGDQASIKIITNKS